jgi:hypothetical protein
MDSDTSKLEVLPRNLTTDTLPQKDPAKQQLPEQNQSQDMLMLNQEALKLSKPLLPLDQSQLLLKPTKVVSNYITVVYSVENVEQDSITEF